MDNTETNQRELQIEKWVYGGAGLGRLDGQVVLVPFVLPGETVHYATSRPGKDLLRAHATEWLVKSPERQDAPCPYFGRCGGCDYQHAGYEFQLARKVDIVREVFARVGKFAAPDDIRTISGEPWGYRNRSQFHIAQGKIGYLEAGSHKLVAVDQCPISSPRINEALKIVIGMMKDRRWAPFIREVELFTNEKEVMVNIVDTEGGQRIARSFFDWCAAKMKGGSAGQLDYPVGKDHYRVSHGSFFQTNRFLLEPLTEAALAGAEGQSALDLYCGVGLFTIPLARRFAAVTGVESSAASVRDLAYNAEKAEVTVDAQKANADHFLEQLTATPDFVLADPPRAGLGPAVTQHLIRLKPPKLNIVACDPATLARDLAKLIAAGYALDSLTLVDLFPQTYHIECVACLSAAG